MLHEIDFEKATFDDLRQFAMNLLQLQKNQHPQDWDARIAYYTVMIQTGIAQRTTESTGKLTHEVDQMRQGLGRGLDKLRLTINEASEAADRSALAATTQARHMVYATWGLVVVTGLLMIATASLVWYTRALVLAEKLTQ